MPFINSHYFLFRKSFKYSGPKFLVSTRVIIITPVISRTMEWINKIFFKNFESLYKSLTLEFGFYTAKLSKSGTQTKICFSHIIEKRNSVFLQCYCSKFLTVRHILYILKGVFTNHLAYICLLFYIKSTFRKNITYRARILPDYICRKVIFETC